MSGEAQAGQPWDGEGEEPTTILQNAAAGVMADPFGPPPEDEATHILQVHGPVVVAELEDEATTIQTRPMEAEDDERTSILPLAQPDEEATSVSLAPIRAPSAQDATEIMRAVAPAGLPSGEGGGRSWFEERLADFTGALLQDEAGALRPPQDRRALGATARDMIARVALRDAPRPGEGAPGDATLQPGQLLINTYFVRALIARGGVGEIYRARHRDLKTEHAIKILLPRYALDPTILSLMLEEARLLALVRHEAVVACHGLLRDVDGRPMLVMEFLRGCTLSARLRDGPLPPSELAVLAQRLAGGLAAIHAQGVVHQDISPDNIILAENSAAGATIIDFGLARALSDGAGAHLSIDFAGKFSWCAPEQLAGRPGAVDARSDLYSLGLVLAAAGLGYRLDMGNDLATARAARQTVPLLPGIAEPVASVARRLLAPAPAGRPASANEVVEALKVRPTGLFQRLLRRR